MHLDLDLPITPWQFSTLALRKRTASTTVGHALSPEKALHFWSSSIAHTVQNLPPQCASLLETFSVSVDTPLTLSVQNT